MPKPLRSDFAAASVGLTLPAQHKNLGNLHDWLVEEVGIGPQELVIALTNYQQGRFGRLPSHVLLVTTRRVAYTHDGGLRSVPLSDLDASRIGLKAGVVNGEITLVLRSGEQLNFRRGMSVGMMQIAAAIESGAGQLAPHPSSPEPTPSSPSTAPDPAPAPSSSAWSGRGDNVIQFSIAAEGLHLFRIRGGGPMETFSVWALSAVLQPQELLVNTSEHYSGVSVAGMQGQLGGLQVNAEGPWSIEPLDPSSLPVFDGSFGGSGDAAIFMRPGLEALDVPKVLKVQATSRGNIGVWAYGASPALLVNTIGSYAGTVIVQAGTQFLAINCDGHWSLAQ